jgi:hypothetical protein
MSHPFLELIQNRLTRHSFTVCFLGTSSRAHYLQLD